MESPSEWSKSLSASMTITFTKDKIVGYKLFVTDSFVGADVVVNPKIVALIKEVEALILETKSFKELVNENFAQYSRKL